MMSARSDLWAAILVLRLGPEYARFAAILLALGPDGDRAGAALAKGDHRRALRLAGSAMHGLRVLAASRRAP